MTRARHGPALAVLLLLFALRSAPVPARAQGPAPGPAPGPAAPSDTASGDVWRLDAEHLEGAREGEEDIVHLTRVSIRHDTTEIVADRGIWRRLEETADLEGHVVLVDGRTTIRSDRAVYARKTGRAVLDGTVTVSDGEILLTGTHATWDRNAKRAEMTGPIRGREGSRALTGDRVVYLSTPDLAIVEGAIRVFDDEADADVTGERLEYERATGRSTITGNPRLVYRRKAKEGDGPGGTVPDTSAALPGAPAAGAGEGAPGAGADETMTVTGGRIRFTRDRGVAEVEDSVRVVRDSVEARSDHAVLYDEEDRAVLWGSPVVTERDGILRGDTLTFHFRDDELDHAVVQDSALVVYRPTEGDRKGEESTVTGEHLLIRFADGGVQNLVMTGEPRTLYLPGEKDRGEGAGPNIARGDTVRVEFRGGKIDHVVLDGGGEGQYAFRGDGGRAETPDTVRYKGDRIVFRVEEKKIELRGASRIDYRTLILRAASVDFDADTEILDAFGDPVLTDTERRTAESDIEGERMQYSLRAQKGVVHHGRTRAEKGFYGGEVIAKGEDNSLAVRDGEYTTCDLAEPHYHFRAKQMRVYLNDKVIAKPITLYIRKLPVFMLPFYIFPIERGRHSGFLVPQFEFGFDQTRGRFVRNAGYYWAMNDYMDLTGWADYYEIGPRIVGSLTGRYALRYRLAGDAFLSYSRDQATARRQWDLRGNHSQTLGPGFTLTMHGDFVSDATFRKDTESRGNLDDRLDQILRSNLTLAKSWSGASLTATASRTENLGVNRNDLVNENMLTESLPQLSFVLTQRPVGRAASTSTGEKGFLPALASLRYGYSADLRSDRREDERNLAVRDTAGAVVDTLLRTTSDRSSRVFHTLTLNDSRALGFLTVIPSFTVRESWVDRTFSATDTVKGFARAATWSFSTGANTNLYGTFAPAWGSLVGIRHTVVPAVSFSYQPEFRSLTYEVLRADSSRARLPRYPGVSASESRFLSMSLENRLQAKVKHGEEVRRLDNLLSWRLSSTYDFLARKRNLERSLSNIQSTVDTRITERISFDFDSEHDPRKRFRFERANFRTGTSFRGDLAGGRVPAGGDTIDMAAPAGGSGESLPWSLTMGFSYAGGRVGRSTWDSSIRTDLTSEATLTKNWRASYSATVDLTERRLLYQRISFHRNLHCWEASFDRTFSGNAAEYYFRINIKDLPDIRYERGRGQSSLEGLRSLGNLPY